MNVLNFSEHVFTNEELEVLSLGLGFVPDMELNRFDLIKDVHLFMGKLCLKTIHHKQETSDKGMETLLSHYKSECRSLKEFLETEDEIFNTQGLSTLAEPDLIDLINLEVF